MSLRKIEARFCDVCDTLLGDSPELEVVVVSGKDICVECLKKLHLEYMRVVEKQVPTRRGGFRSLGEIDT